LIELDKAAREAAIASIQRYFEHQLDEPLGNLQAGALLDFFVREIGPSIYNRAIAEAQARLAARVAELKGDIEADQAVIAQEIVRVAARSDISEEIVRFRAHLAHWQVLADGAEPCGRKLDFLLQEMNREINTIGSKADGVGVSELIVTTKAELEKMREQVQNVE